MEVWDIYAQAVDEYEAQNYDAALALLEEIKQLDPKLISAAVLHVNILYAQKTYSLVIPEIKKLLPKINVTSLPGKSTATDLLDILGHAQYYLAMPKDALKSLQLAAQLSNDDDAIIRYGVAIFCAGLINNFPKSDFRVIYASLKKYLADIEPYPRRFYAHEKIRVGFLSADFYNHSVMRWSWTLLTRLDKNRFDVYCYSSNEKSDKITEYLRGHVAGWRDIRDLADKQAAQLIRDDEIDILFDLSGYTMNNRLRVAAYHPASVQISGIGYTNSTGLDAMDYFLSDVHCAGDDSYFTEKLIRLPHSHICYEPMTKLETAERRAALPCQRLRDVRQFQSVP